MIVLKNGSKLAYSLTVLQLNAKQIAGNLFGEDEDAPLLLQDNRLVLPACNVFLQSIRHSIEWPELSVECQPELLPHDRSALYNMLALLDSTLRALAPNSAFSVSVIEYLGPQHRPVGIVFAYMGAVQSENIRDWEYT